MACTDELWSKEGQPVTQLCGGLYMNITFAWTNYLHITAHVDLIMETLFPNETVLIQQDETLFEEHHKELNVDIMKPLWNVLDHLISSMETSPYN